MSGDVGGVRSNMIDEDGVGLGLDLPYVTGCLISALHHPWYDVAYLDIPTSNPAGKHRHKYSKYKCRDSETSRVYSNPFASCLISLWLSVQCPKLPGRIYPLIGAQESQCQSRIQV